jgi:FHS family L-fucose permease-like MFS transporter
MYPCIFSLATHGLGHNTRRGAALVVMGVSGGAVFPPMQGAIKDAYNARVSFFIVLPCFVYIALWAAYTWVLDGRQVLALKAKPEEEWVADVEAKGFENGSIDAIESKDDKAEVVQTDAKVAKL